MKAKKVLALATAAVMAMALGACGSGADNAKEEQKELTIWVEKIFSDDANKAMEERIESFAEEKGVKVNYEFISATDFVTKLNAAIEAGSNVPDITTAAVTKIVNYYPSNPYMDVSDLVDEINQDRPYMESIYEGSKIEGKHYFVPMTSSSTMMFIRKDKLEEAGISEIPQTWDELFEAAEAMSDPANGFYGLGMGCGPTDEDGENMFRMIMWNQGGYVFDETGNVTLDNDAARELLETYKDLYDKEVIPPAATTWDSGGNNTSYLMGESGIVFNAPTLYNSLKTDENYKELLENTEVVNLPAGRDNNTTMGFAAGLAVMEGCEEVDLAKDLIRYLMEEDWYNEYLEITAPVYAPVFEDCKGNGIWADGVNAQVISYAENSKGYYGYPVEDLKGRAVAAKNYFTFPMANMLNQVTTGAETVDGAISGAVAKIEEIQKTIE